ncbi:hypothetical protein HOP50_04g31760 [Chloropicon primus]|nr:hypothetical protein HOP50_04g31760 [Chloropicon primus]
MAMEEDNEKKGEDNNHEGVGGNDNKGEAEAKAEPSGPPPKDDGESEKKKTSVIFADRKITTSENVDEVGLYAMCRSWFKNETEVPGSGDKEGLKGELMKLPPPLPRSAVAGEPAASSPAEDVKEEGDELVARVSSSAKKGGEDATHAKDVLFKAHMKRWKAIKKEKSRQHRVNSERFEERLKILLDNK